jgi:CRISPR/Cas system endoribonuclease Cas6 (RAMP superfamily)
MSLVHTLAAYALYAGVGKGTAMGLGQCRKIEE